MKIHKKYISRLVEICAHLAEVHPYVWKLAWEAVHRLSFLLPHDQSYNAFRHFIAIRPEGLFLDVGANDGISVLSFRKFNKDYRILALEPNPALESALKRIKSTDVQFDYKMVGAGASALKIQFFVPAYKGIVLHTFTSSRREQVENTVAKHFGKSVAAAIVIKAFEAEIIRLDDLGVCPTIIKIDAEGFDYDVLTGLTKTIERSRPFIVTEIDSSEYDKVKSYLSERNYVLLLYDIYNDYFCPSVDSYRDAVSSMAGHRNFFAVPSETVTFLPFEPKPDAKSADKS